MKMKNIKFLQRVFMVSTLVLVMAACKDDFTAPAPPTGTPLATLISTNEEYNILTASLKKTALFNSLNNNNSGQFTLWAPKDSAMIVYYKGFNAALVTEADVITFVNGLTTSSTPTIATVAGVLNFHVNSSAVTASLITGNQVFATLQGSRLSISKTGSTIILNGNSATNGAKVKDNATNPEIIASNGVVHMIDHVMAAISNANILTPFGLTVSYATNPPTVGGGTTVDGNTANFNVMSIMIRVTGQAPVLLPNTSPLPDFTVFTPTDAAMITYFSSINAYFNTEARIKARLDSLAGATPPTTNPTLAQLTDIVKYHILPAVPPLPGRYLTSDFTNGQVLATQLTGKSITVAITGTDPNFTYTLGDLNAGADPVITTKNVLTNSGIQHIINGVLLPQ